MPHRTDAPIELWRNVLSNAHKARLDSSNIEKAIEQLAKEVEAPTGEIVQIALGLRLGTTADRDPLVIRYVELLLKTGCILPSSLLFGILKDSAFVNSEAIPDPSVTPLPSFEEKAFLLVREFMTEKLQQGAIWKFHSITFAVTRWLHLLTERELAQQLELGPLHTVAGPVIDMYQALGLLAYTIFSHEQFREVEHQPWWKSRRPLVAAELAKFDLHVLQWCRSQLSGHLQALTRARPFLEIDEKGRPMLSQEQILSTPEDLPLVRTRGGLFVWLVSCLSVRPAPNDSIMRNHLLVRYHDDAQTASINLIVTSFDVLTNSMPGKGTPHLQKRATSFICNRLPLLLSSFATLMPAGGIGGCISMALVSIELGPVTPLGTTTAETKELIKKAKVQFLQACILHAVIAESSVASIMPEQSITSPKGPRHHKATLLNQCTSNITRLDALSLELDTMNGNAGAIAGCIAELVSTLCNNKDTMTLKTACAILLKRVSSMEYVFQFVTPATITIPLCHVLNEWTHDQDQTEFQPPYEEFAVILLFLTAIVHGYNLTTSDLGLSTGADFCTMFLNSHADNVTVADMTEEQNRQLSSWIQGLYATDEQGETIGITDETYSQCPPQAFYLLVPVLFEQTLIACKSKVLGINTMKGGLEFLLEPFLLPSLISGLTWIANTPWTDADDTNIRLQFLDKLLKSSSSSQEVQIMLKNILTIIARPLEISLQRLIRIRPDKKKEADRYIALLMPHLRQQDSVTTTQTKTWAAHPGGISGALRSSLSEMIVWAAADGGSGSCPRFTPELAWDLQRIIGTAATLHIIVAEFQKQTNTGNGAVALDVCTALLCAPDRTSSSTRIGVIDVNLINLREHLRLLILDQNALLDMSSKTAEAIIRLHRSVEAQSALSQLAAQLDLVNLSLPQETTDQVMQDLVLGNTEASIDAVMNTGLGTGFGADAFGMDGDTALNLNQTSATDLVSDANIMGLGPNDDIFGGLNLDMTGQGGLLSSANGGSSLEANPDDDIFGDLDMSNLGADFDFS